jgi:hypothetical protein
VRPVAVLFAREDSVYKALPGCDVWDIERDARRWPGGAPVVAHPPCRAWGRLRHWAKPRRGERALALFSIRQVRQWGGVLEHPAGSLLWRRAGLPRPLDGADAYGGWTLAVAQKDWGHRAHKSTWLYIVGVAPRGVPPVPLTLHRATHTVGLWSGRDRSTCRPELPKGEREATPPVFAAWLLELARSSRAPA